MLGGGTTGDQEVYIYKHGEKALIPETGLFHAVIHGDGFLTYCGWNIFDKIIKLDMVI